MRTRALRLVEQVRNLPPDYGSAQNTEEGWIQMPWAIPGTTITAEDVEVLPDPVRRYFLMARVVGKRRPGSFSIVLEGRIRNSGDSPWMPIIMRQFNRIDNPARIVFIEAVGKPMAGVDSLVCGEGRMLIKLFGIIKISDSAGKEMAQSALVTFLNDLVMCPAACFSLPLFWKVLSETNVLVRFKHAGMTVTAELAIDRGGRVRNWTSSDRYADVKGESIPDRWATPFSEDQIEQAGLSIPASGSGIHDYNGNPFTYVELDRISNLTLDSRALP